MPSEYLPGVVAQGAVDAIVSDHERRADESGVPVQVLCNGRVTPAAETSVERRKTEWVLLTSGTTGAPKMLVHSLASLTAAITNAGGADIVWGTFYDIRRYGGLQILFRTILGHGSLVVSGPSESISEYLVRLGAHGATHVSGTPSHWRKADHYSQKKSPRFRSLTGKAESMQRS